MAMRYINKPQICKNPTKITANCCKPNVCHNIQNNQKEFLKRGMAWTKEKPKGTTFKVQSIAIATPLYIDLIHQWQTYHHRTLADPMLKIWVTFFATGLKRGAYI